METSTWNLLEAVEGVLVMWKENDREEEGESTSFESSKVLSSVQRIRNEGGNQSTIDSQVLKHMEA